MRLLFLLCTLLVVSCKGKMEKLPEVVPLDHPAIVEQEFIYELEDALTPECHASTVEVSNGTVIASWFGGTAKDWRFMVYPERSSERGTGRWQ